jgi:CO/xanthine dehydrogenase FAD-binding subunit
LSVSHTFAFREPATLEEACRILADNGPRAALLAGGTDLLRNIRYGEERPEVVVSVARIPELQGIRSDGGGLRIGAAATMADIASDPTVRALFPVLAEAAGQVGSAQVRNRATMGGNLCNASPCADTAPPSAVCGAELRLTSTSGSRTVRASEFMNGPGTTVLAPGEILAAIHFPPPVPHSGGAFLALGKRRAMEITIVSASAALTLEGRGGVVKEAAICLGSVAPIPMRARGGEALLLGKPPTDELFREAAAAASAEARPIDDLRASAEYRRAMVEVLTRRALSAALHRATKGAAA